MAVTRGQGEKEDDRSRWTELEARAFTWQSPDAQMRQMRRGGGVGGGEGGGEDASSYTMIVAWVANPKKLVEGSDANHAYAQKQTIPHYVPGI